MNGTSVCAWCSNYNKLAQNDNPLQCTVASGAIVFLHKQCVYWYNKANG